MKFNLYNNIFISRPRKVVDEGAVWTVLGDCSTTATGKLPWVEMCKLVNACDQLRTVVHKWLSEWVLGHLATSFTASIPARVDRCGWRVWLTSWRPWRRPVDSHKHCNGVTAIGFLVHSLAAAAVQGTLLIDTRNYNTEILHQIQRLLKFMALCKYMYIWLISRTLRLFMLSLTIRRRMNGIGMEIFVMCRLQMLKYRSAVNPHFP